MKSTVEIRELIANTLAKNVKAYDLPDLCLKFGLQEGTDGEAFSSKRIYVRSRLKDLEVPELLILAEGVNLEYPGDYELEECVFWLRAEGKQVLSGLTRKSLLESVLSEYVFDVNDEGYALPFPLLDLVWPLESMQSSDHRCVNMRDDVNQHFVANDDYSPRQLFEVLGLQTASDLRWYLLLETLVHPEHAQHDKQLTRLEKINTAIRRDGVHLDISGNVSGYPFYKIVSAKPGVSGKPKNVIFAADGPKPDIILSDAINNNVEIVSNAEFCLVYDDEIPLDGLRWTNLVDWWIKREALDGPRHDASRGLYARLFRALPTSSPPARLLFKTYYQVFDLELGEQRPALLPEVYLHYDQRTVKELHGKPRLPRQRMDFLLLLESGHRVVLEVDGKHHYASNDRASPKLYGEMVAADRQLRLLGYEIYRFGGAELSGKAGESLALKFFQDLLQKHSGK